MCGSVARFVRCATVCALILSTGVGCSSSSALPPTGDFCDLYVPVFIKPADKVSDATADEILDNNAVWYELCHGATA